MCRKNLQVLKELDPLFQTYSQGIKHWGPTKAPLNQIKINSSRYNGGCTFSISILQGICSREEISQWKRLSACRGNTMLCVLCVGVCTTLTCTADIFNYAWMYVHLVFDSMVILFQLVLQMELSWAFKAKIEGFKCALGKLLASQSCGTPGQQESILLQIRAPPKCFTKSALSFAIAPRAIQQPATVKNVSRNNLKYIFFSASTVLGGGHEWEFSPSL